MALTPETLLRHELNGLRLAVVDAPNPDLVGICGRVVGETMRTLRVDVSGSAAEADAAAAAAAAAPARARVKQVPKRDSTFEFELPARAGTPGTARTDEAADAAKASGTASKLRSDTAGGFDAGQSGRPTGETPAASRTPSGNCEGAAYVTVDGTRLLSRPALRTEKAGDSLWR
ncbi:MAG: ribonuclease P protein component 1 [Haloquadratum sp.]